MKQFIITLDLGAGYTKKKRIQGSFRRPIAGTRWGWHDAVEITTPELARECWELKYPGCKIVDVQEAQNHQQPPCEDLAGLQGIVNRLYGSED